VHLITKAILTASAALALSAACAGYYQATEDTLACTVTGKGRVYGMDGNVRAYQLHTADCGDLHVADVLLRGAWDSIELYRSIEIGKTYEFITVGAITPTVIAAESTS